MEALWISPYVLALIFLGVSIAYTAVGLGGGTSYTALLAIFGAHYVAIPTLSLTLNVIATSLGSFAFLREGHGRLRLIGPFLLTSVPAAYFGGLIELSPILFYWILLLTLSAVAARIYLWDGLQLPVDLSPKQQIVSALLIGTVLGLIAGIVGIGGGIYLVPLVIMLGLGTEREAAACGAVFTLVNSVSGLAGRLQQYEVEWAAAFPLVVGVLIGAGVGAALGTRRLSPRAMQQVLGAIVLVAIALLARRLLFP